MDPNEFQMLPDDSNWARDTPDLQPLDNSADMASQLAGDQTDAPFAAHPGSSDTPALLGDQHIHEWATLGDHTIDASGHMDGQQLLETNSLTHDVAHGPHSEITFGSRSTGTITRATPQPIRRVMMCTWRAMLARPWRTQ